VVSKCLQFALSTSEEKIEENLFISLLLREKTEVIYKNSLYPSLVISENYHYSPHILQLPIPVVPF
jgi:hypothetical protein